uniref:Reverse transcriptase domain-containing protein n=1 Tax=Dicentrarchus labrax TaxID=13489 RepID=A0A8P4G516_DICLA
MPPLYSTSVLHSLNNHQRPDCTDILRETGLLRRPPHRGSGRMFIYNGSTPNSIPSIWSCSRTATSSLRHHNKRHVHLSNLRPLPRSSQPFTKQRHLKLALLNTRSLNNKSLILNEFITDNNLDFLCITETWHKPLDYFLLNQTTPTGYTYIDKPRPEGRGGGVAAIYRKDIKTSTISIPAAHSFEHLTFKLSGPTPLVTAIIYRPPKPNPSFLTDFSDFLTQLSAISPSVLLLGDFNIHIDNDCKSATEFLELLHCFNFTQHVNFPTHSRGHILDLVCSTGLTLHHLSSFNLNISDHLAIITDIDIPIPTIKDKRTISFRNLKSISPSALTTSLASKISSSPPPLTDNPSDLTKFYNETLSSCLHQLAPIKTKTVSFTHSAPWYTPELHKMKSRKRQLERLYKKTGLTVHLQTFTDYLLQYKDALNTTRSTYYSHLIHAGSTNPKALFSIVNKLLKPSDNTSKSFTTDKCNSFLSFFQSKIDNIYNNLSSAPAPTACNPTPSSAPPPFASQPLSQFCPVSPGELPKIMTGMKTTTCVLDPIPSHLIKDSLPAISTLITEIINSSLKSGSVPRSLKLAAVTPILKKPGLNPDIMSNFRPISNLPFLSKILERIVATQLKTHLCSNELFEPFQSGFRSQHSTETALLKVTNDILLSADSGHLTILILLDLTAAFDTINHTILLSRLESSLSITGTALSWLKSYLTDRQQFIHINNCTSSTAPLSQGVPQGSVLGPLLFILYLLPIGNIIRHHGLHFHCYADDIQLYISTKSITPATHFTLSNCLTDIKSWMHSNFLKLNCDKSDLIIIGPKSLTKTTDSFHLTIDNSTLSPSPHSRNLGVIFDNNLSFEHHINQITRTAFFHLKNIARLRPSLSFSAAETLIHAFITSRIDYCNSILYGTPSKTLNKLQYIHNSAARMLTHTRTRDHITPILQNLHWLPVPQRIQFKILLLTHKALHNQAPSYLTDLLHRHNPSRSLRSSEANLLTPPPRTKHRTWGDRAFSVAAPSLWNSLPKHIRYCTDLPTFKSLTKTHLFKIAFNV